MKLLEEFTIQREPTALPVMVFQKRKKHSSAMFRQDTLHIYLSHHVRGREYTRLVSHFVEWGKEQEHRPHKIDTIRDWIKAGQITSWAGTSYTVSWKWTTNAKLSVTLQGNELTVRIPFSTRLMDPAQPEQPNPYLLPTTVIDNASKELGKKLASIYLPQILPILQEVYTPHFSNFTLGELSFQYLRSRWGSCDTFGNIILNTQLLFLPRKYLEYVIIHELSHLRYKHHKSSFWAQVRVLLPNYESLRKELNRYG